MTFCNYSLLPTPMYKIDMDILRTWVDGRVIQVLGQEDDVVVGLVIGWVETAVEEAASGKKPADPRLLQVQLTGYDMNELLLVIF